ncbi:MAG TPA: 50S ribosomal protein L19 [Dehalococcoidia bacterium]|nr:50S ribosomal protein L19 [Dehalococcoidia bacterium]
MEISKTLGIEPETNGKIADFNVGDTVKAYLRIVETDPERNRTTERVQAFEGVCIRRRKAGNSSNFTLRRIAHGVGVERTFMVHSPRLEKVEVVRRGKVRRARLYYLRSRSGKSARIKEPARVKKS